MLPRRRQPPAAPPGQTHSPLSSFRRRAASGAAVSCSSWVSCSWPTPCGTPSPACPRCCRWSGEKWAWTSPLPASWARLRRLHQPVGLCRRKFYFSIVDWPFRWVLRSALGCPECGKGRVYKVHTFGFGSRRMWVGSGRIPYVSVGVKCLQGRECSSSPTSGTCFPCSGACGPLSVYKSPFMGPCGGPFLLVAVAPGGSFSWLGQRCCCVLLHGRKRLELHDLLSLGIKSSCSSLSAAGTPGKFSS